MSAKRPREERESEEDDQSDEEGGIHIDEDIYIPPPPRRLSKIKENHPRLIITKINITNFKSYAGKVSLEPFHQRFSAIVGPNGSGKSNVIDAMLFVFGYRATRIRSTSVGVLIHSSAEHPGVDNCKVSIYFGKIIDTAEGYQIVPGSELKISRRGYKNNSSRYEMDDRVVKFKKIERRLKDEGIDLDHSRFLILQGEVEQIALMKPKAVNENDTGMLEFLDTIIGTIRLKEPLAKISEKLEDLSERHRERETRMRMVEEERNQLRGPMQEAVEFLERENIIEKLKNEYLQLKKHETVESIRELEESNREVEEQYTDLMNQAKEVQEKLTEVTNEYDEKSQKWSDIQRKKDAIDKKYEELNKHDENLHAQLIEQNNRRKENKETIKAEEAKREELKRVPEENAKKIQECEQFVEKQQVILEREEKECEEMMKTIHKKTEPLNKEREKFQAEMMKFTEALNETRAAFDLAESELKIYLSTEEKEREALDKIKNELQTATERLQQHRQELETFERRIPVTTASLKEAQDKLKYATNRDAELTAKLNQLRAEYSERKQSMNSNNSRNKVLKALMGEKSSGRIRGILGRLGDLGGIDAKYDIAVSTACGPLDNIVVDTVETAEACIKFLKENNIGRVTIIPLDKQQRWVPQMDQQINTPENVPRLFDLIRVNDVLVKPAFYYGLKNTLVANDLDQATRIAYGSQRHRVVTLKGELIETTGTMSGGGSRPMSGRMGQSVRTREYTAGDLQTLQANLDDVFNECNNIKAKQPELEENVRTLTTELQDMKKNQAEFSAQVEQLTNVVPTLKKKLKVQMKKHEEAVINPQKVEELTQVRDEKKQKFERVNQKSIKIQSEIDKINDKINEIAGSKIKEKQKTIKDLVERIEKAKNEITRLKVAISTAEKNAVKAKLKIENLEKDIEQCVQKIKDGQQEKAELEEVAKKLKAKQTKYQEMLVERDECLGGLNEEIKRLQAEKAELKANKIQLQQKIDAYRKNVAEFKGMIKDCETKLAGLKLRKIPEQEVETLKVFTDEELADLDLHTVKANLDAARERLPREIPNMQTIEMFEKVNERFFKRLKEVEEISAVKALMRGHYDRFTRMRLEEFKAGYEEIRTSLKELYQMITQGGGADLEYADTLDPYREGIVFSVRPPKKSWKNISNLSGGEKTLSSLALVFALHNYKPTPLYFMDEIDAALDFKNVSIIANYIKDRTKNAQFIVVSLRSEMFALAETLVGIYKTHNATKTVIVNIKELYNEHPEIEKMDREREERHQGHRHTMSQAISGVQSVSKNHNRDSQLNGALRNTINNNNLNTVPEVDDDSADAPDNGNQLTESPCSTSSNPELDIELGLREGPVFLQLDDSLGLEESSESIDDTDRSPSPKRLRSSSN